MKMIDRTKHVEWWEVFFFICFIHTLLLLLSATRISSFSLWGCWQSGLYDRAFDFLLDCY